MKYEINSFVILCIFMREIVFSMEAKVERAQFVLIDSDVHRRAKIAHELTNLASYVIPLEHYSELTQCWPKDAVLLVEDAGGAVDSLCRLMHMHHKDLPFVAFSADASPQRRSAALLKGAGAYLPWPCGAEELKSTLLSVATAHSAKAPATSGEPESVFPQLASNVIQPQEDAGLRQMRELWRASNESHAPQAYAE